MRVAFVLGTTSGGTGRHVLMLVEGLVRRGHSVLVAGPRSVQDQFAFTEAGARFFAVPVSDRPHPVNDLRAVSAIRRMVADADVVHAHGLRAGGLTALSRGASRLVVTLHNALTAGGFIGAVYGVLERIVARSADAVLVVSPDLGERMRSLGAKDVRPAVVPAPAPRPVGRTAKEVRAELGLGDLPLVLAVGRLAQQKGYETLLDASAGVDDAVFLIAGDGPLRQELQARIDAEGLPVRLLGNRDDVPDLLGAAAVAVWASRWEGLPLSVSEALMAGKPIIATAVGGIPVLVGEAGILVPYGDAEALRSAVRKVTREPDEARRLARASALRGEDLPTADDAVESILAVYGESRSRQ